MLIGFPGEFGDQSIYDVTDAIHPALLCHLLSTSAHLSSPYAFQYLKPQSATQTAVISHTYTDGGEAVVGNLPAWTVSAAWLPNGAVGAYTIQLGPSDTYPVGAVQVGTYSQGAANLLFTYGLGMGDCICRFGFPGEVLRFSPDGQYLAAGELLGKGSNGISVYRMSDRVLVASLGQNAFTSFWDVANDRLFATGYTSVEVWTPSTALGPLAGANGWSYYPNLSPDGEYVAYTAFSDQTQMSAPRVYLYTLSSSKTQMIVNQPRSQALFVKAGWIWYLEEAYCSDCPNNTQPTGNVYAMNLSTGSEQQVVFAPGESTTTLAAAGFWQTP